MESDGIKGRRSEEGMRDLLGAGAEGGEERLQNLD